MIGIVYDLPPTLPSPPIETRFAGTSKSIAPPLPTRTSAPVLSTAVTSADVSMLFPVSIEPRWVDVLASRTQRILRLSRGWDGPGSEPVQPRLLDEAIRILRDALVGVRNAAAPYLIPGGDGSIQIEWHEKSGELELDLAADGSHSIWIRDYRSGEEIEGENDRALALFSRWAARVASISDDENYVPRSTNTAVFGAYAGSTIYSYNTIS